MKVFFLAHGNSRHYLKPGTIANNMYVQQPGVLMGKSFYLRTISGHGGQRSASRAWHSFLITKPSKQAAAHTLGRWLQGVKTTKIHETIFNNIGFYNHFNDNVWTDKH